MPRRNATEVLGILPHMPAFDSCFPLLERLHLRGHVDVRVITGPRLRATEPRVPEAISAAGMTVEHRSLAGMELFSLGALARAGAVLTHADPVAQGKRSRPRDLFLRALNTPVIFVQHGLLQIFLHYLPEGARPVRYHAGLMLLWRDLTADERARVMAAPPRTAVTGLLKRNRLPLAPPAPDLAARIDAAREVVLVCHNYGHEAHLYDDARRDAAFAAWREVFAARPDTLFLIRSHRGRKIPGHDPAVGGLIAGLDNVLVSDRHDGLMAFSTIHDVLAVSDRVVTHPSTVVLDALGEGRPVALIDNHLDMLADLPQIGSAQSFLDWLDARDPMAGGAALMADLGEVDANLDRAANLVERHLAACR